MLTVKRSFNTDLTPNEVIANISNQIENDFEFFNFLRLNCDKDWYGHIKGNNFHLRRTPKFMKNNGFSADVYGTIIKNPNNHGSSVEIVIKDSIYHLVSIVLYIAGASYVHIIAGILAFIGIMLIDYFHNKSLIRLVEKTLSQG
ncbi:MULTISPECIES: hypothetical protein [unclassified Moraxella]|uniref:hypothetical protein n=1 Tax=unclassified Moraxella TaxID=2685852 RepID=UPI003AF96FF2